MSCPSLCLGKAFGGVGGGSSCAVYKWSRKIIFSYYISILYIIIFLISIQNKENCWLLFKILIVNLLKGNSATKLSGCLSMIETQKSI